MSIKFDSLPIALPTGKTISQVITSGFGRRNLSYDRASKNHGGVDIAFAGCNGKPIFAVAPGKVLTAGRGGNEGNFVVIEHTEDDGVTKYRTGYCHMLDGSIAVRAGQTVTAQQVLGKIGSTGASTGPHLHFLVRTSRIKGRDYVDPLPYLRAVGVAVPVDTGQYPPSADLPVPPSAYKPSSVVGTLPSRITGLQSFHPYIQYELTRRRKATETANAYMPFVQLTSLTNVLADNAGGTSQEKYAYCPSLGIHGQPEESFLNIYTPQNNRSIVGYATRMEEGEPTRVPITISSADIAVDPPNIPPPGIVGMTTERSTAGAMGVRGGLFRANVKIVAYSVGQMNALLRYFLRPATRVVLEFGRKSSNQNENPSVTTFDWKRKIEDINSEVEDIVRLSNNQHSTQERFIRKYIYDNFGKYEIYVGYVVTFKFKYTKSNTYEIDLTIHSAQQFEVPIKMTGARALCGPNQASIQSNCGVLDIEDFFNPTSGFKENSFSNLLGRATDASDPVGATWNKHVIKLGSNNPQSGTGDSTYLVSWRFFIDVILNDELYGIASVFQSGDSRRTLEFLKNSFPKPIGGVKEGSGDEFINQYEVSWHRFLRSTDAGTMIIDNPSAQEVCRASQLGESQLLQLFPEDQRETISANLNNSDVYNMIAANGEELGRFQESPNAKGISSLTKGVWLNSNAIIESFTNADTVSAGLENLLVKMNNATQGFWNLQLLSNDQGSPGIHVIDMGESKQNMQSIRPLANDLTVTGTVNKFAEELEQFRAAPGSNFPQYLYMFNRKLKRLNNNQSTGGELLDINYEASLPQVVAVQAIAGVGGVAQRGTLSAINIDELKRITLYDIYPSCTDKNNICSDTRPPASAVPYAGFDVLTEEDVKTITTQWEATKGEEANQTQVDEKVIAEAKKRYNQQLQTQLSDENIVLTAEEKQQLLEQGIKEEAINNREQYQYIPQLAEIRRQRTKAFEDNFSKDVDKVKTGVLSTLRQQNSSYVSLVADYSSMYGKAIEFIAYDKTELMQEIDYNRSEEEVHPFNSSNLTKTTIDLTLPGIGGISLFEAFAVDRIPNILSRGYYIVTKVAQEFSTGQGWITKITGRFRFKPSGVGETSSSIPEAVVSEPQDNL